MASRIPGNKILGLQFGELNVNKVVIMFIYKDIFTKILIFYKSNNIRLLNFRDTIILLILRKM